jgi:hypothetical protein
MREVTRNFVRSPQMSLDQLAAWCDKARHSASPLNNLSPKKISQYKESSGRSTVENTTSPPNKSFCDTEDNSLPTVSSISSPRNSLPHRKSVTVGFSPQKNIAWTSPPDSNIRSLTKGRTTSPTSPWGSPSPIKKSTTGDLTAQKERLVHRGENRSPTLITKSKKRRAEDTEVNPKGKRINSLCTLECFDC